jgi:chromosome partitioning protein
MAIIAVLNQKGGSAKTTTVLNIAGELARRGARVLVVDTDPQMTSSDWRNRRGERDDITVAAIPRAPSIVGDVPKLAAGYDVTLIDGAGSVSDLAAASVKIADAVLIPVQPSAKDLWATQGIVDLVRTRHQVTGNGKPPAVFIVARAIANTRAAREVDEVLLQLGLPVLDARMHNRQAYASCDHSGQAVCEYEPNGDAAREIAAIVDELLENAILPKLKESV